MKKLNYFRTKPKAIEIDTQVYLKRLGLEQQPPSLEYLKALHYAHVHTIPFENLDIHYNRKIILDFQKIFHKIVIDRRGGFCYELNGLFYHLLYHLGFSCYCASAQFLKDSGAFSPDFDHLIVIVRLDDKNFLVDVGFGEAFIHPKKIETQQVQIDYTTYWKFEQDPDENYLLSHSKDASVYHTKYRFDLEEKQLIQFMEMCEYHQTSVESMFTNKKLITVKTKNGRVTLTDKKLKVLELGEV
ncbi:MAG: arylamine N-acetyltransferase, partial [Bacteroidota bacterium]